MPTAIAVTSPDLVLPSPDRHTPSAAVLQSAVRADRAADRKGAATKANPRAAAKAADRAADRADRAVKQGKAPQGYTLDQSLAEMHTLIEHHGYVIVLCPASAPDAVVHRLHTVRSVLESDRIALLRPDLPPLGLAVLALQLRQLTICDFSPGVLASSARLLAHYIYAGALLGSVAKLDRVPVGLKAHAKSWVPGSQFAVLATPQPELVRVAGSGAGTRGADGAHAEPALSGPAFATRMFTASGQLATDWVTSTLAPAWRVQGVTETRLPAESARWWATGRIVEFAAAIPDISVLYQLVSSVRRERCHWCGLELIGDRCGFCSAPLGPPPERIPAVATRRGATTPTTVTGVRGPSNATRALRAPAADARAPGPPNAPAPAARALPPGVT
ncbi:hypothetical protein ACFVT5_02930 [Streptomyces sp. NPDC058001]|uniref:hypothetical protein n=1 Tax=Streptomyces sp. NPDC058001 TaxID=3346300 RepID=UPI0036E336A3